MIIMNHTSTIYHNTIRFFYRALVEWKVWVQTSCFSLLGNGGWANWLKKCYYIEGMFSNWNTTLDRVQGFSRDKAINIKKAKLLKLLKYPPGPCFIHTLQLIIKDLLFEDERIKLLLAKVRKLVCQFSLSSKASELLKKFR